MLFGESLGGGVASELAAGTRVGGLILQSTFTSLVEVGAELFPWLPVRWISSIRYDTCARLPLMSKLKFSCPEPWNWTPLMK